MKKAVLIAALVIGGLAMVWAVNVKKTPDNIPTEVEASAAEQAELKQVAAGIDSRLRHRNRAFAEIGFIAHVLPPPFALSRSTDS